MKVLFVDRTSARGGAPRSLSLTISGLQDAGVDAYLLSEFPSPATDQMNDDRVELVWSEPPWPRRFARLRAKARDVRLAMRLRRSIRRHSPDVVHFNLGTPAVRWVVAACPRLPIVVHERGVLERGWVDGWLDRRRVSTHVCVAHSLTDRFGRCVVIPNPVAVRPEPARSVGSGTDLHVLAVGRDEPQKGLETLLEAGEDLRGVEIRIAGFEKESISEHVRYLGWVDDIDSWIEWADVVCVPSLFGEGSPRIVLQALGSGRPIVASDLPSLREAIPGGGLFFDPGDSTSLATILERLEADRSELRSLAKTAASVSVGASPSEVAGLLMKVYEDALDTRAL